MGFSFGKNLRANVSLMTVPLPHTSPSSMKPARERFIDDGDVWGSGTVALVDSASLEQTSANSFKIVRSDPIPGWRRPAIIRRFSLNAYEFVPVVAAQRAVT